MNLNPQSSRREFLRTSLLGFGGVLMLPSCLKNYSPFLFLTIDEASCLSAICEQIIPADANGPGATQAGVIYYIDKQLHDVFKWDHETYRNGLNAIQVTCRQLFNKHFEDLNPEQQIAFLKKMESGKLEGDYWTSNSSSSFFSLMVGHSMQGFYGPPRHGGNKNYMSYKMVRLDYPYVVGQNRYRNEPISN